MGGDGDGFESRFSVDVDMVGALCGDEGEIALRGVDGEGVAFQLEARDGIFALLIVGGLAVVFVEVEGIIRAREEVDVLLGGILGSSPADAGRERDDGSRLGEDGDVFERGFHFDPLAARERLAREEVGPRSRWQPDSFGRDPGAGVRGMRDGGDDQL